MESHSARLTATLAEPCVDRTGTLADSTRPLWQIAPTPLAGVLAWTLVQTGRARMVARLYEAPPELPGPIRATLTPGQWRWALEAALRSMGWVILPTGRPKSYDEARSAMDPRLCARLARILADGNTAEAYVAQYCLLHEQSTGKAFRPLRVAPTPPPG